MRVLSVDDNEQNLYLLEAMLPSIGWETLSTHNGVEGMEELQKQPFDLIISDILMPQMDGFEFCHWVKQHPVFRRIPFIFYTATYTDEKDEELGLALGASRFIVKPAAPEDFLATIRAVVEECKAGRLPNITSPVANEEVLVHAYNRRLVQKLDRKVEQLEKTANELKTALAEKEHEIAERRQVEDTVRALNQGLEQSVQHRTAELSAANKNLETFASAVSHDLRVPLRSIEGWSDALESEYGAALDDQARNYLSRLRRSVQRMNQLIDALLKLAQAGRGELRKEPVSLSCLALEIGDDLRRKEADRLVRLTIAPDLVVQGDPALLRSVLQNLLENAWKFTVRRREASIEFGLAEAGGKPAYFVRDNGAGFRMEDAPKLFVPFERLHHQSEFPGTGIGLATVQQIIRRHGGDVWAKAAPDKGATFYFTLQ